jgi:hypothetical protein
VTEGRDANTRQHCAVCDVACPRSRERNMSGTGVLRNCALEQLAGFAVEEREAEMGHDLKYAAAGGRRSKLPGMEHLADERDWHRVGAHAVARDAAGGVGSNRQGVTR